MLSIRKNDIFITDEDHVIIYNFFACSVYLCITYHFIINQLKAFATIFLLLSIFLQTFSTLIIQADFYWNRSDITKSFCENLDKPMMHCKGKCYLSKKLKQQEKQDQQAPVSKNEKFDILPFFVPKPFLLTESVSFIKNIYF